MLPRHREFKREPTERAPPVRSGRAREVDGGVKAQALMFVAPGRVDVCEVDIGEPGEDDVVVRTGYSGISAGTEMLAYRGELDPSLVADETIASLGGSFAYPFPYGYSCAGVVEGGALPAGTAVFAFHPHQDRFVARRDDVVPAGDVPLREATLFPLVETALQITLDSGPVLDEVVVVTGLGTVGLLTAVLLGRAGGRVLAAEPRAWRRTAAAALGVDACPPEEIGDRVEAATGGRGVGLVVEASGNPGALGGALPWLAHEGTALVASWYGSKPVTLPLGAEFHRRRLTIRSTQVSTIPAASSGRWSVARRRDTTRRLLGELPLAALATHEFPLADAAAAFAAVDRGDEGLLHAALWYG
jgi:2-desacetyl-2-hydroxyethyl bacteriochlorophyllide A dehydrogenase